MRRAIVLALMVATASALWADTATMVQIGFMGDSRTYSDTVDTSTQGYANVGLNLGVFTGEQLGLLSVGSLGTPLELSESINGVRAQAPQGNYDAMIGIDGFIGPGYRIGSDRFESILGAGVHVGGLALTSFGSFSDSLVTFVLGAGVSINALYRLDDSIGLSISALTGYDFFEFFRYPDLPSGTSFVGGFRMAISFGIGFRK